MVIIILFRTSGHVNMCNYIKTSLKNLTVRRNHDIVSAEPNLNCAERKKIMNNKRRPELLKASVLLAFVLIIGTLLCGCAVLLPQALKLAKEFAEVETSEKYLVGFDYSSYKDVFGMAPVITCRVRYDKSVDATFVWIDQNGKRAERTLNFAMTDDQYSNIAENIDPQEIYYLNPKCSDPNYVLDGGSSWLFVYGPDDAVLKECGGFCPTSKRFHEIRRILFDNLPAELVEVYSQYEELYDAQLGANDTSDSDEAFRVLFEETYSLYIKD